MKKMLMHGCQHSIPQAWTNNIPYSCLIKMILYLRNTQSKASKFLQTVALQSGE